MLLPIASNADGYLFATDVNRFWKWKNNIKSYRLFDFIVNRKTIHSKGWILNETKLINMFGNWNEIIDKKIGNKIFRIYLYPKGIHSEKFYSNIESSLKILKNN